MAHRASGTHDLLIVANEPTPYNTDLFNALAALPGWRTTVFYAQARSWEKDAGHDYRRMPEWRYEATLAKGKGLTGQLVSTWRMLGLLRQLRPAILLVSGYNDIPHAAAIVLGVLSGVPFAFWVDQFNLGKPRRGGWPARMARDSMRRMVFKQAAAVLVCGRPGYVSARSAGCPESKLVDFPYVVDVSRIQNLAASCSGVSGWDSRAHLGRLILFSGRLIARKGLDVLFDALDRLHSRRTNFFLVVEGDGPLRADYERKAQAARFADNVRFVGFRQMDEHAFLLSKADIVVVPSTHDPWGLVVHEGMLMGKPVCASSAVGAAVDRIVSGRNGFIFPSGDADALAKLLTLLLEDDGLRRRAGQSARETAKGLTPERNARVLLSSVLKRVEISPRI